MKAPPKSEQAGPQVDLITPNDPKPQRAVTPATSSVNDQADVDQQQREREWDCYGVSYTSPAGRHRRAVFFSLNTAVAAVERARARGGDASLTLVRIVPVGGGE